MLSNGCCRHTQRHSQLFIRLSASLATLIQHKPRAKLPHFARHKPSGRQRDVTVVKPRTTVGRFELPTPFRWDYAAVNIGVFTGGSEGLIDQGS